MKKNKSRAAVSIPYKSGDLILTRIWTNYFEKGQVKFYFNALHHWSKLSPVSRTLIIHLCEEMDQIDNKVRTDKYTIQSFQKKLHEAGVRKKNGSMLYGEDGIRKAFLQLREQDFLITTRDKGINIVNPRYFYKDSELQRKSLVQKLMKDFVTDKPSWANSNIERAMHFNNR